MTYILSLRATNTLLSNFHFRLSKQCQNRLLTIQGGVKIYYTVVVETGREVIIASAKLRSERAFKNCGRVPGDDHKISVTGVQVVYMFKFTKFAQEIRRLFICKNTVTQS